MIRKYLLLIIFCIPFMVSAQKDKKVDTSQIVISGRSNAISTHQKPYVILISADGFRYDYFKKYNANHLLNIANNGVWAKNGMYPSYPSITFPNYYTLVTGMYPAHHGIVDNTFFDPSRNETYKIGTETVEDGSWYRGLPLWGLAENQGVLAASLFWVGSESNAGGTRPTYYYRYHEKFTDNDKVNIIKNWLTLPEDKRPHFITLYFPEVDHDGHKYGTEAKETEASVQFVDQTIQKLVDALAPLNLPINFVFVSDHGMINVEESKYTIIPDFDFKKFTVVNSGTFARITAKDKKDVQPVFNMLQRENYKNFKSYLATDFPEKLHYSTKEDTSRRIGDIILVPKKSKVLTEAGRISSLGKHGFNVYKVPEMKAAFVAWGPAFKTNKKIKSFENIHVYPMIAEILGLNITHDIDGDAKVLNQILKK
ncbi:MAG: alkaline phosphatase family protein [Chitinophagaceae bacterium]|nr:MAG: alkaline phosphatase family protein [Chitinophagaceae bacterium]